MKTFTQTGVCITALLSLIEAQVSPTPARKLHRGGKGMGGRISGNRGSGSGDHDGVGGRGGMMKMGP